MKRFLLTLAVVLLSAAALPAQMQTKRQLQKWGQDCLNKRNWECAENAYLKLLEREDDDRQLSLCYNNLGYICKQTGRHAEAMDYYNLAVEKDSKNWKAWSNMGRAFASDERYSEALGSYTRAIENGADDNTREQRAYAYQRLKMWDEAAADYEYLMSRSPADYQPVMNLASVMINSGDNTRAAEYADRAIALNPNSASAYVTKGIALLNLKDKAGAKDAFEKAVSLGSDNPRLPGLIEKCAE